MGRHDSFVMGSGVIRRMTPDPITKLSIRAVRWVLLVLVWSAGLVALACSGDEGGASRSGASAATFVGRETCAECHAEEDRLWAGSHHDLAMQVAGPDTVLGDFDDASFTYGTVTTTFSVRDGRYIVRTDGPDGELQDFEVAYAFGVDPLQQYLIERPGGRLQALSIAWDGRPQVDGGQRWFHLYPDEAVDHRNVLHWTRFSQNWNLMCAECHSTNLRRNYDADADAYQTTWSELDVSCEACHGPGSRHVGWAREGRAATEPSLGLLVDLDDGGSAVWNVDSTTGLATRSVPRRSHAEVETCARCHSRRASIHEGEYGLPLLDTYQPAFLLEPLYFADGQVRDEVYVYGSFLQSRMYRHGVTCSDCHNPHSLTVGGEGNARCAGCHLPARFDVPSHHHHEAGSPGASCVACHMPSTTFMGVDARRDHSFRIPRPDLTAALGVPNACAACHADQSAGWAVEAVTRWHGPPEPHFAETFARARSGDPQAAPALAALAGAADVAPIVRATAVVELQGFQGPSSRVAIEAAARSDEPLVRLGAVAALESSPPAGRVGPLASLLADPIRAVRLEAARALASTPATMLPEARREARDRALDEYRQAQALHADRAEAHINLGVIEAGRRNLQAAESAFETAIARNPFFAPAYVNLAEIYRIQARDDEAATLLTGAIERVPDAADLHHALGLVQVRQGRRTAALASLRRAAALAPDRARFAYVLGVALNSDGQAAAALAELRRAYAIQPANRDVLAALATISRDSGALAEAVEYARGLVALTPGDPEALQLLSDLERARSTR